MPRIKSMSTRVGIMPFLLLTFLWREVGRYGGYIQCAHEFPNLANSNSIFPYTFCKSLVEVQPLVLQ